ncbi:MAG: rod shape-determining protein RodA [bacterium]|nr:rod shape-determining protein RodA [bacterium]
MQNLLNHIRRFDWLLTGAVLALVVIGLISLFSLSSLSSFPYFNRQLVWFLLGIIFMLAVSRVDFRTFRTQSFLVFLFYLVSVLLLSVLLFAGFSVRGHSSWFKYQGFSLQPVETTKLVLIILLAKFFSKRHIEIYQVRHLLVSGVYLGIPTALVLLQPDLGSAIILVSVWVAMIVFSGMKLKHFMVLLLCMALVSGLAWSFALKPYQKARVTSFLNPYNDSKGAGYQMIQSMIAVGSGRIWGKGMGYGSQSHLNFLPEAETDFIFAAYAEEWGFAGVSIMISLLFFILWRAVRIGLRSSDNFSRLYTLGFAAMIFVQSFIHIGMNMGVLPVTGITLPFVSYGGSSLITLLIGVGILQNIRMNSRLGR